MAAVIRESREVFPIENARSDSDPQNTKYVNFLQRSLDSAIPAYFESSNSGTRVRSTWVAVLVALISVTIIVAACSRDEPEQVTFDPQSSALGEIEISSPAFGDGDSIPVEFTCDGDDTSPPLRWSEPPVGTRALVVIIDDPDAPGQIFRHWSIYNIPSGTRSLKESRPPTPGLENSTLQGKNDFGRVGYGGPCPPAGQEHEYVFFVYALLEPLELAAGASPAEVTAAIRGRVLGAGSFSAMYARR